MNQRIRAAVLAVVTAAALPRAVDAQDPPAPGPPRASATTAPAMPTVARDADLAAILNNPKSSPAEQKEAARRLAARRTPESLGALTAALKGFNNRPAQLAAAEALDAAPNPDPALIDPLFALLGGERALSEAAARALVTHKDSREVLDGLTRFVADPRQPLVGRQAAARALGRLVEPEAARVLVEVLSDRNQNRAVRDAAGEGLVEMTGLRDFGQDPARWRAWLANNAGLNREQWKASLADSLRAELDRQRRRHDELRREAERILSSRVQDAQNPEAEPLVKADVVAEYLGSDSPDVRVLGAQLAQLLNNEGRPLPELNPRLARMVGDSDPEVRIAVAEALADINYDKAVDALLAQVEVEQDAEVRAALAQPLGKIGDLRAVEALMKLLDDRSPRVMRRAAEALERLGPALRGENPQLVAKVAAKLRAMAQRRDLRDMVRAAAAEALAPLRDPGTREVAGWLKNESSPDVRRALLRALGELGDPNTADSITNWIPQEEDPEVRREALDALGKTGGLEFAGIFIERMRLGGAEPDAATREFAGKVFESLLPGATKEQLKSWARLFRNPAERGRRIVILETLCEKLKKAEEFDNLAAEQETLASEYMAMKEFARAASLLRSVLDYWRSKERWNAVDQLTPRALDALFRSGKFDDGAKLAEDLLTNAPSGESRKTILDTVGGKFRNEAERLMNERDYKNAITLIDTALNLPTPLDEMRREDLRNIRTEVEAALAEQGGSDAGDGERGAAGAR